MNQEIIKRLDLTYAEYNGGVAYKDSNGLIFAPIEHSQGLVMVIDSKSNVPALMSDADLLYLRKEVLYHAIVTTIADQL